MYPGTIWELHFDRESFTRATAEPSPQGDRSSNTRPRQLTVLPEASLKALLMRTVLSSRMLRTTMVPQGRTYIRAS